MSTRLTLAQVEAHNRKVAEGKKVQSFAEETAHYQEAVARTLSLHYQPTTDVEKLNKTERSFYAYLQSLYPWVGVQCITLKLGHDCRFTPDFFTVGVNGEGELWETKGFMRDDAKVKLMTAARMYPMFQFSLVKKDGSTWDIEKVKT